MNIIQTYIFILVISIYYDIKKENTTEMWYQKMELIPII